MQTQPITVKMQIQPITDENFEEVLKYNDWHLNGIHYDKGDNTIHIDEDDERFIYHFETFVNEEYTKTGIYDDDLSTFIKLLEVLGITLKPLPTEPEFDAVQYLLKNCPINKITIDMNSNIKNAYICDLHLPYKNYTKEQCDKIIETIKILQAV